MATINDILSDDHLGQSILRSEIATTSDLTRRINRLAPGDPLHDRLGVAKLAVEHAAQRMIDCCASTGDREARKLALLELLRDGYLMGQALERGSEVFPAMRDFTRALETHYEEERQAHLTDRPYVEEKITRHAKNVKMVSPFRRDPEGIFAEAQAYLDLAQKCDVAMRVHLFQQGPTAGVYKTVAEHLRDQWNEKHPAAPLGVTLEEQQIVSLMDQAGQLSTAATRPYADILPNPIPAEALGFVVKADAHFRRKSPVLHAADGDARTDPRVRKVLQELFSQPEYEGAGTNLSALVAAYQALERRLGPDTPDRTSKAAALRAS